MASTFLVNGGNYLYNVLLAKKLAPSDFAQAGLLINLLLVFSFLAMTFQIVAAKFSVSFEGHVLDQFINWLKKVSLKIGFILLVLISVLSQPLSEFFQLENDWALPTLSMVLPVFFLMSVERGRLQGNEQFVRLSVSYQTEVWTRFVLTFGMLYFIPGIQLEMVISLAIFGSIFMGFFPIRSRFNFIPLTGFSAENKQLVWSFFLLTGSYECAQILINYSDVLLVKHYFTSAQAGWFTSMALIGKVVYFLTWMLAMVLVPKVLNAKKKSLPFKGIMVKYVLVISAFCALLSVLVYLFPREIILLLFDDSYIEIAPLLWRYAVATGLFSICNLFVYFFLSIDKRRLVLIAIIFGLIQLVCYVFFHDSLRQIIQVQIVVMIILLLTMLISFFLVKDHPKSLSI
ncbi:MAG: sugar isomerase [Bacteroidota bacterium]